MWCGIAGLDTQPTWSVNDRQIRAELVLNLDYNLLCPELLLTLQPGILILNIVLQSDIDSVTEAGSWRL